MIYDFTLPIVELNPDTDEPEFSMWALTVDEFKKIYDRYVKKGNKAMATSVMMYIGLMEDYGMWVLKMPLEKHGEYARLHSGINKHNKKWKPDNYVREARKKYKELQSIVSAELNMLFSAEISMRNVTRAILKLNDNVQKIIDRDNIRIEDAEDLKEQVDSLLSKTDDISKRISVIRNLKEEIANQRRQQVKDKIRGGGVLNSREKPEDSFFYKQIMKKG